MFAKSLHVFEENCIDVHFHSIWIIHFSGLINRFKNFGEFSIRESASFRTKRPKA